MILMHNLLSNREKAVIIWVFLFFIWALLKQDFRQSLLNLLKTFFKKKIIGVVLLMAFYVSTFIYLLKEIGFWDKSLIKESVIWFFGTGFIMLMNSNEATHDIGYFKKSITNNIKFVLIMEFIINFYSFNIWIEIIIFPILMSIGILSAISETKEENKQAKKITDSLMAIFGVILLSFTLCEVACNYKTIATIHSIKSIVLVHYLRFYLSHLFIVFHYLCSTKHFLLESNGFLKTTTNYALLQNII